MHFCLQLPEILDTVFRELPFSSLPSASRTCKVFSEHALNYIWHEVFCLNNILDTIGNDLFVVKTRQDAQGRAYMKLTRRLAKTDLLRFRTHYAHRIRILHLDQPLRSSVVISDEVLRALVLVTKGEPGALAPRLRALEWLPLLERSSTRTPLFCTPFLGANISSLLVSLNLFDQSHDAYASILSERYPSLSVAHVELQEVKGRRLDGEAYSFLLGWKNLTELTIQHVSKTAASHLASLPGLKKLTLTKLLPEWRAHDAAASQDIPSQSGFSSLRVLDITSAFVKYTFWFLQRLSPHGKLQSLTITCGSTQSIPTCQTLLTLLERHCNHGSLQTLKLNDQRLFEEAVTFMEVVATETLSWSNSIDPSPLLCFQSLRYLQLDLCGAIGLTPTLIAQMCLAWNNVTHLIFESCPIPFKPSIDHRHFLSLLIACPELVKARVQFDASQVSDLDLVPTESLPPRDLWLEISNSPISNARQVASFFSAHFNVVSLRCDMDEYQYPAAHPNSLLLRRWKLAGDWLIDQTWERERTA